MGRGDSGKAASGKQLLYGRRIEPPAKPGWPETWSEEDQELFALIEFKSSDAEFYRDADPDDPGLIEPQWVSAHSAYSFCDIGGRQHHVVVLVARNGQRALGVAEVDASEHLLELRQVRSVPELLRWFDRVRAERGRPPLTYDLLLAKLGEHGDRR